VPPNLSVNEARVIGCLIEWESGPLVVKLPRAPGRKDSEYMHLFSSPVDVESHASHRLAQAARKSSEPASPAALEQRVSKLEAEVAELMELLRKDHVS
jgi:uncharacterized protein YceH (UPF0502 family)